MRQTSQYKAVTAIHNKLRNVMSNPTMSAAIEHNNTSAYHSDYTYLDQGVFNDI